MSRRIEQVNELIKEEVSKILSQKIDFDDDIVTITQVDTSPDSKQAKVKITVLNQDNHQLVLQKIKKKIYNIQQDLNKKLNMRPVPKLSFFIDQSESKAQRVEELLQQIKKDKNT